MRPIRLAGVVAAVLLLVASHARAECRTWVLWVQTPRERGLRGWWNGAQWTPNSTYESKEACDNAHVIKYERGPGGKLVRKDDPVAGKRGLGTNWRCLSDTVDPRPRGKH